MLVSGFGIIMGFESGVIAGTQKLGKDFAFPPDILERLDDSLCDDMPAPDPSPFSVAVEKR